MVIMAGEWSADSLFSCLNTLDILVVIRVSINSKKKKSKNVAPEKQDKYWNIFNWIFNHLQIFYVSKKKERFDLRQCFLCYLLCNIKIENLLNCDIRYAVCLKDILKCKTRVIWDKVFKNGPSKISGKQALKNFTWPILEYFLRYNTSLKLELCGGVCVQLNPSHDEAWYLLFNQFWKWKNISEKWKTLIVFWHFLGV